MGQVLRMAKQALFALIGIGAMFLASQVDGRQLNQVLPRYLRAKAERQLAARGERGGEQGRGEQPAGGAGRGWAG